MKRLRLSGRPVRHCLLMACILAGIVGARPAATAKGPPDNAPASGSPVTAAAPSLDPPPNSFWYPNFRRDNTAGMSFVDDAHAENIDTGVLRLTDTYQCCRNGAAWQRTQQQVGDGFETVFDFKITGGPQSGADGFAFVIQADPAGLQAKGPGGCGIGYTGIRKSLAIEFDTWKNPLYCETVNDPNDNHISVHTGNTGPNNHEESASLGSQANLSSRLRAGFHTVKIRYGFDGLAGVLQVYLDDMNLPILTVTDLNLSERLGLNDGLAWVGFTAGTGASSVVQTHDILNWYFVDSWDLGCFEYDYNGPTNRQHGFIPEPYTGGQGARWHYDHGWLSAPHVWHGAEEIPSSVTISRGIQDSRTLFGPHDNNEPFEPRWLAMLNDPLSPASIKQIRITYAWAPDLASAAQYVDPEQPAPPPELGVYVRLRVAGSKELISETAFTEVTSDVVETQRLYTGKIDLTPEHSQQAKHPQGVMLQLRSDNDEEQIWIRKLALCIDGGAPPRPPVAPPGAAQACDRLKANLLTREQPFGANGTGKQWEAPFLRDEDIATVTLEPYPEYSLNALGYPTSLRYTNLPPGYALVPCVFRQNGAFYNTDPILSTDPDAPPARPIVRFTAVGPDPVWRDRLVLLNYAAFYSVGTEHDAKGTTWCAIGDNAFGTFGTDSPHATRYGPGLNIPSPKYDCDDYPFLYHGGTYGPCGSFVGSVYRAMGYFNVNAYAEAYREDQASRPEDPHGLNNLYYGVVNYAQDALPRNFLYDVSHPLGRVDIANETEYRFFPVDYDGIRVYPVGADGSHFYGPPDLDVVDCAPSDCAYEPYKCQPDSHFCQDAATKDECLCPDKPKDGMANPSFCQEYQACRAARLLVDSHWNNPTEMVLSPADTPDGPARSVDEIWRTIKPGDIAITVVERTPTDENGLPRGPVNTPAGDLYTHIQIVVGWGPAAAEYKPIAIRAGYDFYPTYDDIPADQRATFVPYVMDRYTKGGAGSVSGPRPFSYMLWHSATDIWVADF